MRKNKNNLPYLKDILEAINSIELYLQDAPNMEEFIRGKGLYQDAIVRNIEIIGEAAKNINDILKERYPNIPWKQMAGMRDKIVHEYANVDWEEVWRVATEDIKELKPFIEAVIQSVE